eukprot:SAG25_NODE_10526_length_330_cov_0.917749_1_plen_24_part_10
MPGLLSAEWEWPSVFFQSSSEFQQ